jgi:NADH-ubiquinone oxidoreductase chain 5
MYLTILILPLLGSFLATNRNCGNKFGPIISVGSKGLAVICCIGIFYEVGLSSAPVYIYLGNWINFGNLFIQWSFLFDTLTVSMYLPIIIISFLVQKYS